MPIGGAVREDSLLSIKDGYRMKAMERNTGEMGEIAI